MTAPVPGEALPARPRSLSDVLADIAATPDEWISLGSIAAQLSDRSYGALLILFSGPNLLPLPPGASTVFGIPLILIAAQLLIGQPQVWLPRALRDRAIDRRTFSRIAERLGPTLQRFELLARPRWWLMPRVVADRLVGGLALLMALILVLPIPFGNWLPALSIVMSSVGMSERDGVWLAGGILAAAASVAVVAGVLGAAATAAAELLG